jgi:hypothetical protein
MTRGIALVSMAWILSGAGAAAGRAEVAKTSSGRSAGLRAEAPVRFTRDREAVRSSSRVEVAFEAFAEGADHYRVIATDLSRRTRTIAHVAASTRRATLEGLASGTSHSIDVVACLEIACVSTVSPASDGRVTVTTGDEVWEIQASGEGIERATRIVSDGNVKVHAVAFGAEAPESVRGRVQLYYGPMTSTAKGLAVAVSDGVASDTASVSRFTSLAGQSGLVTPSTAAPLVAEVATGQAVPLTSGMVRLYFEARGADGRTRILHVDSQDGLLGRDFNRGSSTVCATSSDYATAGPCAPVLDIAVSSDPGGNPGFTDARQFKIAYPQFDDWRFAETPGTFMVLTLSGVSPTCSRAARTSGYALWDGARWAVQYAPNGCPKLFENIQAPMPVHAGGKRYKMYFGNPTEMTGVLSGSMLPWLGPKRVAYADASLTGDPEVVEFEDWEPLALARPVRFVWPSGRDLTATEAGYIDDFVMLAPTGDPRIQVMYGGMTDGRQAPFAAMAVLLNP